MDNQVNDALKELEYLIYVLPKLMCYEDTTRFREAFEIISEFIHNHEENNK